jgi:hypothetical protein
MHDLRQRFFTSVFPKIAAHAIFYIPDNIATSFPPALSRRFASLLVNRINIASLRATKLRSYWKRVFLITSPILLLRFAPQENRYRKAKFTLYYSMPAVRTYCSLCRNLWWTNFRWNTFFCLHLFEYL